EAARLGQLRQQLEERYRLGENVDTARLGIEMLQSRKGHPDLDYLLRHPDGPALVISLQAVQQPLNRLETALNRCLETPPAGGLTSIRDELLNIQLNADSLPNWLPALRAFAALTADIKTTVRRLPLRMKQIEAAIVRKGLQELYQQHRGYAAIDGQALEKAVLQLAEAYPALQELNARVIRAFIRQKFLHQLELSNRAASQLNDDQKKLKKTYAEGRKILENEFGKTMRYKSIRELSEKESGLVLKTLKPVWLMSPYSVSDSLPLDADHFDVVIFDEASQITLEEGVPALYRSRQTIIVGDEKQMPPTDFFTAGSKDKDPDDLGAADPENGEWLTEDADSLLAQGARKLESTLLSWHYRSHYETLISFSNHAFYNGDLLTIPDRTIHHEEKAGIRIAQPEEARTQAGSLFDRSISYHLLTDSVYEKRSNPHEALYIAHLVRELLRRQVPESIGIVAFSQEQQRAIESALDLLSAEDSVFSQQLEEAYNRTGNDQFVGLIVKNLENIQGDERDIIIISVCYGPDSRGRMLMNFGPVNKKGGEKRLNVLFSRARKHLAVVSSIRYQQIINEYNEGASYLRRFLQYAELVSAGRMDSARVILDGLVAGRTTRPETITPTIMRTQLQEQLTALGYEVTGPIGQSDFKCPLAVKKQPGDGEYALAILIDDQEHYRNANLVEQYYQRPAILRGFGWNVLSVYAKDWLHQPQKVLELIIRTLKDEPADALQTTIADTQTARLAFRRLVHPATNTYWEAAADGNKLIIRWGRTGARGQIRLRTLADETTAQQELDRQENEQREKGFESAQEPR
ncbi:MAG TPA: AAA domain-containing protein, partial [Puia sp.]|nr:AAA domain-containing protein [Puia sp.]